MSIFSKAWKWIKKAVKDAWDWVKEAVKDAWDWVKDKIGEAIEDLLKSLVGLDSKDEFDSDVGMSATALTVENAPDDVDQVAFDEEVSTYKAQDGKELFKFGDDSSGDIFAGKADTITNFDASEDQISIPEGLVYSGYTTFSPPLGTYSVWEKDGAYVVTWRDEDGFNDIRVKGDNPLAAIVSETNEKNVVIAGTNTQTLQATEGEDVFVVASETAGHSYSDQEKVIEGFDADSDMIVLPDGLTNAGNASSAGAGQFVVYQSSEMYSDIEFFDPWDAMYLNIPQSPKNKFVVEWNDGNGASQILVDEDPTGKVFSGLDAVA